MIYDNLWCRAYLVERGWTRSGQWWLPPSGKQYRHVCHTLDRAMAAEMELTSERARIAR